MSEKLEYENNEISLNSDDYKCNSRQVAFDIVNTIIVRILMIIECGFLIHFTKCIINDYNAYILFLFVIIILADGFYVVFRKLGKDHKWISISMLMQTFVFVIAIWTLLFWRIDSKDFHCTRSTDKVLLLSKKKSCLDVSLF